MKEWPQTMDNRVLSLLWLFWHDLHSVTQVNQESNAIRKFKWFWVLIWEHLEILFLVLFIY